jgi:carbonic anhydrase
MGPTVERRTVLKLAAMASAGVAFVEHARAQVAKPPPKPENVLSPDAALDRLMKGNARYVEGVSKRHDFSHEREPLRTGQNPFAGVLSCADSRIAPEYCFDTARGDVFVCRVAGNFASDEMVASFEYAVQVLNTPLILVLGHDACGAVDATLKSIKTAPLFPAICPRSLPQSVRRSNRCRVSPATCSTTQSGAMSCSTWRSSRLPNRSSARSSTIRRSASSAASTSSHPGGSSF